MEKYLPTIGKKLFYFRKLNGYTVEQVEEKSGVTVRRQRDLESGRLYPTLIELKRYSELYDFSIDWFLVDLEEEKTPEQIWAEFRSSSEGFGESGPARLRRRMVRAMEKMPDETQYTIARFVLHMNQKNIKKMCEKLSETGHYQ